MQAFDDESHQRLQRLLLPLDRAGVFPVIVGKLGEQGLHRVEGADVRVIVEKPFGDDARGGRRAQPRRCCRSSTSSQVFRIDHYLGKETVQNILAFRFANGMFEPLWNNNYIDNIQITASEDRRRRTRGGYYDSAGVMRDMIQNHMLQMLCHLAMEPPATSAPTRCATSRSRSFAA